MPFGLTNAPSVLQRVMQQVLSGLNPADGKEFVEVYIDDVLIFSRTIEEHIDHLHKVLERLRKVNLKCHFLRQSLKYLGHIITPSGLKPNPKQFKSFQFQQTFRKCASFLASRLIIGDLSKALPRLLLYTV